MKSSTSLDRSNGLEDAFDLYESCRGAGHVRPVTRIDDTGIKYFLTISGHNMTKSNLEE
jgi:hypothetical protein